MKATTIIAVVLWAGVGAGYWAAWSHHNRLEERSHAVFVELNEARDYEESLRGSLRRELSELSAADITARAALDAAQAGFIVATLIGLVCFVVGDIRKRGWSV